MTVIGAGRSPGDRIHDVVGWVERGGARVTSRILLSGGCVLTLGAKTPNLTQADVLIEDGVIAEVGTGLRARDAEVVDATDTIVMPGFVDTHRHVWTSLFRNLGEGPSGGETPAAGAVGDHFEPEDVYAATLIGLLGAAEAGITTVVDWSHDRADDGFEAAALQAHADAGLRTVYLTPSPDPDREAAHLTGFAGPLTNVAFGTVLPASADLGSAAGGWASARQLGLRIHAHAGAESSGTGVIAEAAERGLLGEPTSRSCIRPGSTTPTSTPSRRPEPRCRSRRRARWRRVAARRRSSS